MRLVIQGLEGDKISENLLKLINNPTLFVATTLVGNNVANYLTSLAIVLAARELSTSAFAEMIAPVLMSPLLFVYGELLPKSLFFQAPNRLLRNAAPLFLVFTVIFAPIAALLWGLGRLLERLLGQSPEKIWLALARKEVQEVLEEGLEAGILHPSQRFLSQNFFIVASKPIREVCTPISRALVADRRTEKADLLRIARRKRLADIPVFEGAKSNLVGHVRTLDLLIDQGPPHELIKPRPLVALSGDELFGEALLQMQAKRETLVVVNNAEGQPIGILSMDQLTNPLLKGQLDSLRR